MKKVLAMAIIMTSSTILGLHLSRGVLLRTVELEKARVFIVYIKSQIRYSSQNIDLIIRDFMEEHRGNLPNFLCHNVFNAEHLSVQQGILRGLEDSRTEQGLNSSDLACLTSFISALGRGDIESQTALCDLYELLINERLVTARQRAEKYGGIYTTLCVLGGLAISILLF